MNKTPQKITLNIQIANLYRPTAEAMSSFGKLSSKRKRELFILVKKNVMNLIEQKSIFFGKHLSKFCYGLAQFNLQWDVSFPSSAKTKLLDSFIFNAEFMTDFEIVNTIYSLAKMNFKLVQSSSAFEHFLVIQVEKIIHSIDSIAFANLIWYFLIFVSIQLFNDISEIIGA